MNIYYEIPHGTKGFSMQFFSEPIHPADCHYCNNYEILYMADGKMRFGLENNEYIVQKGDVVFIDYAQIHYFLPTHKNDSFHYCPVCFGETIFGIEEDFCRKFLRNYKINTFLRLDSKLMSRMKDELFNIYRNKKLGYEFILKSWLFEVMYEIIESGQYTKRSQYIDKSDVQSQTVKSIIEYIETHYTEKITLDDIFSGRMYSQSHLAKLFKQYTSMTVVDFLNRYRMTKAREYLISSDLSITNISSKCGFDHSHYFTLLFKKHHGCTPSTYRSQFKHNHG